MNNPVGTKFSFQNDYSEIRFNDCVNKIYDGNDVIISKNKDGLIDNMYSQSDGGSIIGRSLLEVLANSENIYIISFEKDIKGNSNFTPESISDGMGGKITVRESGYGQDELMARMIHELVHGYTYGMGYDNLVSISYQKTDIGLNNNNFPNIRLKYAEATAVAVETLFRKQMGIAERDPNEGIISINNGYGFFPQSPNSFPAGENNPYYGYYQIKENSRLTLRNTTMIAADILLNAQAIRRGR